ncbi:reverse transcriptase domain-containing protein [Tanacetum coccineum]
MVPATAPLIGFNGEIIWPIGQISLSIKIGDTEHSTSTWMNFVVVISPYPYNGIIGRPRVRKIQVVPSTAHEMTESTRVAKERIKMAIHPEYPEQTIAIGSTLTEDERKELCALFRRNLDIFAWKPTAMTRVPRHIAEHWLNVREGCPLLEDVCGLQRPEQGMSQRWLSAPIDRLKGGIPLWIPLQMLLRCNAGATYQRLVEKAFKKQIGINLEVFVDDLGGRGHVPGIHGKHQRDEKAEAAFKQMKKLIAELPTLTAPMEKEKLIVYLAAVREAVSIVLMTEKGAKQMLIYFVSRALQGMKINYTPVEKLVLALVHASKRLTRSSCNRFSLRFGIEVCGGKEEDVGLGELGEGGKGVVSKIGEIGGDIGRELFGDRGGE